MTSLASAAWPRIADGHDLLLVVPLGSCEQHGPHLPFDVDTTVAGQVASAIASVTDGAVLGPALGYGASGEHEDFPGTVSIGPATLEEMLVEIGRSASRWAARVLFVNGHGGNVDAVVAAVGRLRAEGRDVAWWACGTPGGDAHAGHSETSMLLALRPDAVDIGAAEAGRCEPVEELMPQLRAQGVRSVAPNGVLGDPTSASADDGRELLAGLVAAATAAAGRWRVLDDGRLSA